jgi:site-specific DNA recombinase
MRPDTKITEDKIAAFTDAMRASVLSGETPFRRAYIRSVIDQVDDAEIRIIGRKSVLERLVTGGGAAPAGVPSFVRKWRTRHDSNVWPSPSEGDALSS